ncbi:translation initiation protein Sua5 [Lentithecium fluviatile CBS 122367]|uniref:Threonylcarbamoyl-AMP synthase n=1 Tax=Lentithecium fluviatile CBS 122367 TaxID=1168545 RepID=A0A6G1JCF7_9PLEO|nr:translation initiation protein Sua5 [Lentithecium fluviatile CBS 122367]
MPIRCLRIPNVHHIRAFASFTRAQQNLAQVTASEPARLPLSSLKTDTPILYRTESAFTMDTNILPVDPNKLGKLNVHQAQEAEPLVEEWSIEFEQGKDFANLQRAAQELRDMDTPVAFPTETVYGLGADARRSSAVRAIFAAKGRPADNPLIVHIHSIPQLRALLSVGREALTGSADPIPDIYKPLIKKFWPGPLTIILPNPKGSLLAPEVTAGLDTFGARMPRSILTLALMRLADVPLAGPSANASTRPSPTAAEHVKDDLDGRIHTIIDGGPCEVGVESTVVDGLSHPPTILRPGGVTVEQLRRCPGWENVVVGYKDRPEQGIKPRAPGMKYRHYSPKATVVLYEAGSKTPQLEDVVGQGNGYKSVGIVRSKIWPKALGLPVEDENATARTNGISVSSATQQAPAQSSSPILSNLLRSVIQHQVPHATPHSLQSPGSHPISVWDVALGTSTEDVARGLFSALRELDKKSVDVIFVEGIDDHVGDDIAAAVMNRLRKAAEIKI